MSISVTKVAHYLKRVKSILQQSVWMTTIIVGAKAGARLSRVLGEVVNCERCTPVRQADPDPGTGAGGGWHAVPGRLLHVAVLLDDGTCLARRSPVRRDTVPSWLGSRGRWSGRYHAGIPRRLSTVHGGNSLLPGHD